MTARRASTVTVTARSVRAWDVILIAGQPRTITAVVRVRNAGALCGGARLHLDTGELLVIAAGQQYTVTRPEPAWQAAR